jgi:hypothetical protein
VAVRHRSPEEYDRAVRDAAKMMARLEQPDGTIKGASGIEAYYTRPMFYRGVGDGAAAMRCLNVVRREFMRPDGSLEVPDAMSAIRPYPATWLTVGATAWGRFDVGGPACSWLCTFHHQPSGGFFGSSEEQAAGEGELHPIVTGAAGLAAIYGGRTGIACRVGEFFVHLHRAQPDLGTRYLMRCRSDGKLVTDYSEDEAPTSALVRGQPRQHYWWIGMSLMFLSTLYMATGVQEVLRVAQEQYDWAIGCHEDVFETALSHKLCGGAALLHLATGSKEYLEGARRIADYLVSVQREDGSFAYVEAAPTPDQETTEFVMDVAAQFGTWIAMTRWML